MAPPSLRADSETPASGTEGDSPHATQARLTPWGLLETALPPLGTVPPSLGGPMRLGAALGPRARPRFPLSLPQGGGAGAWENGTSRTLMMGRVTLCREPDLAWSLRTPCGPCARCQALTPRFSAWRRLHPHAPQGCQRRAWGQPGRTEAERGSVPAGVPPRPARGLWRPLGPPWVGHRLAWPLTLLGSLAGRRPVPRSDRSVGRDPQVGRRSVPAHRACWTLCESAFLFFFFFKRIFY